MLDTFTAVNAKMSDEEIRRQVMKEFEDEMKNKWRPASVPKQETPQGPIIAGDMFIW